MTIIEIIKTYELEELGVEIKDKAGDYIILQSANIWSQYVNPKDEIMQKDFTFDKYVLDITFNGDEKRGMLRSK